MEGLNPFAGVPQGYTPEEYCALKLYANLQIKKLKKAGFNVNPYQGYVHALNLYTVTYRDKPEALGKLVKLYRDFDESPSKLKWIEEHSKPDACMILNKDNCR
jgi:hypothetical protein